MCKALTDVIPGRSHRRAHCARNRWKSLGTPHFGVAHRQRWWPHGSVRERPIHSWIYSRMYSMVRTLQPYADGCTARGSFRQLVRPVLEICVRCRELCSV
jgi:hypothetical protein